MSKEETKALYRVIKDAEDRLAEIRGACQHLNFSSGFYSYRPGVIFKSNICDDCGECLERLDE